MNQFGTESMNHLLQCLTSYGSRIECLALSQTQLQRENVQNLVHTVQQMVNIRKLNLSGNEKINQNSMQQIIRALINNNTIEDFDLSGTGVNNDQ